MGLEKRLYCRGLSGGCQDFLCAMCDGAGGAGHRPNDRRVALGPALRGFGRHPGFDFVGNRAGMDLPLHPFGDLVFADHDIGEADLG